jgi:hypothetical protein
VQRKTKQNNKQPLCARQHAISRALESLYFLSHGYDIYKLKYIGSLMGILWHHARYIFLAKEDGVKGEGFV